MINRLLEVLEMITKAVFEAFCPPHAFFLIAMIGSAVLWAKGKGHSALLVLAVYVGLFVASMPLSALIMWLNEWRFRQRGRKRQP